MATLKTIGIFGMIINNNTLTKIKNNTKLETLKNNLIKAGAKSIIIKDTNGKDIENTNKGAFYV